MGLPPRPTRGFLSAGALLSGSRTALLLPADRRRVPCHPHIAADMQGYPGVPQQYNGGPMGPMLTFYSARSGAPGYPGAAPMGMYPQQPIPLGRFPGSELHAPSPGQTGGQQQMYGPQGFAPTPLSRAGSAGGAGRPPAGPPPGYGTGPPPPGMQPFQPLLPHQIADGPLPRPVYSMALLHPSAYQQPPGMPIGPYPAHQQLPVPRAGSGATTPKGLAGSGSNTPMHPLQRGLSGGSAQRLMLAPGGLSGSASGYATPHLQQGGITLMQPPPGIVLPDTLSPPPAGALHGAGPGSLVGSRMQSAAQQGHARAGSYGSGLIEPLMVQAQGAPAALPTRTTLVRTNSTGSIAGGGSLRSSLEFGGMAGGLLGGGVSPPRRTASSGQPKASSPNSRVGSAGRRSVGSAAAGGTAPPALDEYDNIKARGCVHTC